MVQAVLLAKLRYRYLQELQVEAEERRRENFFLAQVNIGPFSKPKWLWWIENIWLCNRRSLKQPELVIQRHASLEVWGVHCNVISTGGLRSWREQNYHITNILEFTAAKHCDFYV